ncbi:hypothetical protein MMC22_003395 [Lobaria immixta]|nr:hypothetical protein [Lobaria immixta]
MELDDLSSRKSIQRIQVSENASEHPAQGIKKTVEQAEGERDVLAEHPPDEVVQDLGSSEQLPSTPPNIITTPRNTENPILRFIIFLSPQKWWSRHISLVVLHTSDALAGGDPRDYLSLERTFLAYIRTASALVSLGVIVTQLFMLKKQYSGPQGHTKDKTGQMKMEVDQEGSSHSTTAGDSTRLILVPSLQSIGQKHCTIEINRVEKSMKTS